jgi:hypothetical protein
MSTYSRYHPGKYSLFIDWETSGADFSLSYSEQAKIFQGIQLGLVIADNETFEEVDSLKLDILFDSDFTWQDEAQKVHGITREYLSQNGIDREAAAVEAINFLLKYFSQDAFYLLDMGPPKMNPNKLCFGGHNLDFDIEHFLALLAVAGLGADVHHVKLNTTVIGFHATGLYRSNDLFTLFGAEARGNHDALEDARQSLAVARGVKQLILAGLSSSEA